MVIRLKPRSQRSRDSEQVIEELRDTFNKQLAGMTIEFVLLLQDMLGDLEGNPEPIEVKIFGDDVPTLTKISEQVAERMKKIAGVVDIVIPQRGNPELDVHVDPTRAAKAGFTVEQVSSQLTTGMLGANIAAGSARAIGLRTPQNPFSPSPASSSACSPQASLPSGTGSSLRPFPRPK